MAASAEATLVAFYKTVLGTGSVPPAMQSSMLNTFVKHAPESLAHLASIDGLSDETDRRLARIKRASVREAWVANPRRDWAATEPVLHKETRIGVLVAAAGRSDIPAAGLRRLLDMPGKANRELAEAVLKNPNACDEIRKAATVVWAQATNQLEAVTYGQPGELRGTSAAAVFGKFPELLVTLANATTNASVLLYCIRGALTPDQRNALYTLLVVDPIRKLQQRPDHVSARSFRWALRAATSLLVHPGAHRDTRESFRDEANRLKLWLTTAKNSSVGMYVIQQIIYDIHQEWRWLDVPEAQLSGLLSMVKNLTPASTDAEVQEMVRQLDAMPAVQEHLWVVVVDALVNYGLVTRDAVEALFSMDNRPACSADTATELVTAMNDDPDTQAEIVAAYLQRSLGTRSPVEELEQVLSASADRRYTTAATLVRLSQDDVDPVTAAIQVACLIQTRFFAPEMLSTVRLDMLLDWAHYDYSDQTSAAFSSLAEWLCDRMGSDDDQWSAFESVIHTSSSSIAEVLELVEAITGSGRDRQPQMMSASA